MCHEYWEGCAFTKKEVRVLFYLQMDVFEIQLNTIKCKKKMFPDVDTFIHIIWKHYFNMLKC